MKRLLTWFGVLMILNACAGSQSPARGPRAKKSNPSTEKTGSSAFVWDGLRHQDSARWKIEVQEP